MGTPVIITKIKVPSYIQCFEDENEYIHLIYAKRPSTASTDSPLSSPEVLDISENEEKLDLTGDPLKVDLGGNDSFPIFKSDEVESRQWPEHEMKHFPLSVRDGRKEINKILMDPNSGENCHPIYVVCGGDDIKHTILLGGQKNTLTTSGIYSAGVIKAVEGENKVNEMVKDHMKNCSINSTVDINYLVKMKYDLVSRSMLNNLCQNASMRHLKNFSNVSFDVMTNKCIFNVDSSLKATLKMNLELVAGHKQLTLNFIWDELFLLQKLIDTLSSGNSKEDTALNEAPLDLEIVLEKVVEVAETRNWKALQESSAVDFKNLRNYDMLDELWQILKYCNTLGDLQQGFYVLFEELASSVNMVVPIKEDTSNIGRIIRGISSGKIILSSITLEQSVELLFELGAQKLKCDLQVILAQFIKTVKANIKKNWQCFSENSDQKNPSRKTTRVTQHIQTTKLDVKVGQLAYLSQLYVGAEFIYLVKEQVKLTEHSFWGFCNNVEKEYVLCNGKFEEFLEIYQSPLCEMSVEVDHRNVECLSGLYPSRWTVYMISKTGKSKELTTVYDLSEFPVFPPIIFKYDDLKPENEKFYYITKMSRSKGLL